MTDAPSPITSPTNANRLAAPIDANFDTRRGIYTLPQWQIDMVERARACGAGAKFARPGGAIVGTYDGDAMFQRLRDTLASTGSRMIEPDISS